MGRNFESKGLRVNVKTKMVISSENAAKVTEEGKFPCAAYRRGGGSNSTLCSGIRGKLKEDGKFKFRRCENQQTGMVEDYPGIQLNDQSLEIVEVLLS